MSFPLDQMRELGTPVARVVVAATQGSVPREVGASMLVTRDAVTGTIGGGALEYDAIARARLVLDSGEDALERLPLGPALGQCCGGLVTVLTEIWNETRLAQIDQLAVRPLPNSTPDMPLSVRRLVATARSEGHLPKPHICDGWMIEPVSNASREVWIWGAGHVGRALVGTLLPLPDIALKWADSARDRFPDDTLGLTPLVAENPADLVNLASDHAEHVVLTYSHALDLELCNRILSRPFKSLGLIGSATKWARFRSRLRGLGHPEAQIDRIQCPIGDPSLGKHPQTIALGVAAEIVKNRVRGNSIMTRDSA